MPDEMMGQLDRLRAICTAATLPQLIAEARTALPALIEFAGVALKYMPATWEGDTEADYMERKQSIAKLVAALENNHA